MKLGLVLNVFLLSASTLAAAESRVTVTPPQAHPGDPVLVTVTGSKETPKGTANGEPLHFFAAVGGYQAVVAIPLDAKIKKLAVEVDSVKKPGYVQILERTFPETDVIVEEELANPSKADGDRIGADNRAIIEAVTKSKGEPQFTRAFHRPAGEVTSPFGEWRSFNDGHRAQHLGLDLFAREGSKVAAVNSGTVTLVRDCFLAGNVVVVAHGGGLATAYFHLSKISVAEGDVVAQGAELGLAGHTGRTTGPHLHVSVRVPGGFVDPAAFFKLKIAPRAPASARR